MTWYVTSGVAQRAVATAAGIPADRSLQRQTAGSAHTYPAVWRSIVTRRAWLQLDHWQQAATGIRADTREAAILVAARVHDTGGVSAALSNAIRVLLAGEAIASSNTDPGLARSGIAGAPSPLVDTHATSVPPQKSSCWPFAHVLWSFALHFFLSLLPWQIPEQRCPLFLKYFLP